MIRVFMLVEYLKRYFCEFDQRPLVKCLRINQKNLKSTYSYFDSSARQIIIDVDAHDDVKNEKQKKIAENIKSLSNNIITILFLIN